MSDASGAGPTWRRWRALGQLGEPVRGKVRWTISRAKAALAMTCVLATAGFLAVVPATGGAWHPWFSAALLLLAVPAGLLPDTGLPLGLLAALGVLWASAVSDHTSPWTALAAALLVVVHLSCTVAGHGPPSLPLDAVLVRLWRGRAAAMVGAGASVWLLTWAGHRIADGHQMPGWLFALALLAALAGPASLLWRLRTGAR